MTICCEVRSAFVAWSFLTFVCLIGKALSQEFATPERNEYLSVVVVSPTGEPVPGVQVQEIPVETSLGFAEYPPFIQTDSQGAFRIEHPTQNVMGIIAVIHHQGYACDLVCSRYGGNRDLKMILRKERPISVIVRDTAGNPMPGVFVAPHSIDFRNSSWQAYLPKTLVHLLRTQTNEFGEADLHGMTEAELRSVWVEVPGQGGLDYTVPDSRDRNKPVELRWHDSLGSLRCLVKDPEGSPVEGVDVLASVPGEMMNELQLRTPTPNYLVHSRTNESGICLFENIPEGPIDIRCRFEFNRGTTVNQDSISIAGDSMTEVVVQLPRRKLVQFSVVDASTTLGHEGIEVGFKKVGLARRGAVYARGTTNEDGMGFVELEEGDWELAIRHTDLLPDGYRYVDLKNKFRVPLKTDSKPSTPLQVLPLLIERGREIFGTIEGIDTKEILLHYVFVSGAKSDGEQVHTVGKLQSNNRFSVTVPAELNDDQIDSFQVRDFQSHEPGRLEIVSRSPWVLRWASEAKK